MFEHVLLPQPTVASQMEKTMPSTHPVAAHADRLTALPRLGVGLSFQGTLFDFVRQEPDSFDFVEIIPDSIWTDQGRNATPRYVESATTLDFLERLTATKPLVIHSIGLSIGSAERFDTDHIAQIAHWHERYKFPWHSDHLSFNQLEHHEGHSIDVGFAMPIPYDEDVLAMIVERVNYVQQIVPVPFVLENNVYYFDIPDQQMDEATFLNRLTQETGCGLLLDLHNVYTNARNHGFNIWNFLGDLDLTRVVEIHIGGGMMMEDVYLDAHSGPAPVEVWDVLSELLPHTPNAAAVVFEVFGSYYPTMGAASLKAELHRARQIWEQKR